MTGNGNGKGKGNGKKQYYCYLKAMDNGNWVLFEPKLASAAAKDRAELQLQLFRIMQFHKDTEKVLCVKKEGKAPKKLVNLGCKPSRRQLQQQGLEWHKLITL